MKQDINLVRAILTKSVYIYIYIYRVLSRIKRRQDVLTYVKGTPGSEKAPSCKFKAHYGG